MKSFACLRSSQPSPPRFQVGGRSAVLLRSPRQQEPLLLAVRQPSSVLQSGRRGAGARAGAGAPRASGPVVQAVLPTRTPGRHLEPPAAPVGRVRGVELKNHQGETAGQRVKKRQ